MNGSVAAAWETMLSDGDPLEVAKAAEAVIGFCHARQLQAFAQVFEQAELGADPDGVVVDPTPPEIACAMHWTPGAASVMVDTAVDVVVDLPAVWHALAEGRIDLAKVKEISRSTCELQPDDRQAVAARAIDYAQTRTRSQLRAWLARQIDRLDPDAAERRRRAARKRRHVRLTPESDGMATISALLTAEEAAACMESIRVRSNNIDGGRNANQADMFIELLTGISVADPIPVTVIIAEQGAEIDGYGPIGDGHADQLLARLHPDSVTRLTPPQARDAYRPSPAMDQYVRIRDRRCRFPRCRRPARDCDLDHTTAWPTGKTEPANLHPLCRYHHRIKTHTAWQVTATANNTLTWTSPRGHTYISYPDDP